MRLPIGLLFLLFAAVGFSQPCVFSISPSSGTYTAAGGNDVINITQTSGPGSCTRTAVSNAPWITISFGSQGTGSGTVGYTVQSNPFNVDRTGTIAVAGQTYTVSEAAGSCSFTTTPSSASIPAAGANGTFSLTATMNSCPWTVVSNNPDWLTVSSAASGTGTTTVHYSASSNSTTTARTGAITAGSNTFTVTQGGVCAFTLNPSSAIAAATGTTGSIAVQASSSGCTWGAATNNPDWLTLTGATSGAGNGTVTYAAAANTTLQDRSGSISIGGAGFNVFQSGSSCTFALSNTSLSVPASGGAGSFFVNSACPWNPTTTSPDWIVITSAASTTGSGTVSFLVSGNIGTQVRTGAITVGNASYTVTQAGVVCAVTLAGNTGSSPAAGSVGSIGVQAAGGCAWTASTTAGWVSLAGSSGSGDGDVIYTAVPNTTPSQRTAIITIANQKYTLVQDAAQCDYLLTPGQATVPADGGVNSFHITTACSWSATTAAAWITLPGGATGTGTADLAFAVAPNVSSDPRTGSIRVAGQTFTVVQSGKNCTFAVSTAALSLPGRGGKATAQVTGGKGCKWEPSKDQDWLTIASWSSLDGNGSVTIAAEANSTPAPRTATLAAGGQAIAVTQGGLEVILTSTAGVLNAASFAPGPVAPGEILTIFGQGVGPNPALGPALAADGQHLASTAGQVQVLFDGIPAPLIYVSDKQVSMVVPYGIAGKQTTELKIVNQGVESNPLTLPVAPAAPAIFSVDGSGKGAGAIENQDGKLNTAANPAQRGSIVQIFATGEGATMPGGEDGKIAAGAILPKPQLPVTVLIGGQTATVLYAGAAPGAVAGLFQVNARIAANAQTGAAVPVVIRVGQAQSQSNVTLAVR